MITYDKQPFPVARVRKFLEPGPVVLVSTFSQGRNNIMTMGWHTMMEFSPSLVGCVIARNNHSHAMLVESGTCVINVPTHDLVDQVVGIGNCSGAEVDKFEKFGFTAQAAMSVEAPLIRECYASFECRIADASLVKKYDFFVLEVVQAHVAVSPKQPQTLHYRGDGVFMVSGKIISRRSQFKPEML